MQKSCLGTRKTIPLSELFPYPSYSLIRVRLYLSSTAIDHQEPSFFFDKKRLNLSLCSTNLSRAKLAMYHTLGLGSYYIGLGLVSFYKKKTGLLSCTTGHQFAYKTNARSVIVHIEEMRIFAQASFFVQKTTKLQQTILFSN